MQKKICPNLAYEVERGLASARRVELLIMHSQLCALVSMDFQLHVLERDVFEIAKGATFEIHVGCITSGRKHNTLAW